MHVAHMADQLILARKPHPLIFASDNVTKELLWPLAVRRLVMMREITPPPGGFVGGQAMLLGTVVGSEGAEVRSCMAFSLLY